jgi:hypothetical protein
MENKMRKKARKNFFYILLICGLLFAFQTYSSAQQIPTAEGEESAERAKPAMATFYYNSAAPPAKGAKPSYSVAFKTGTKSADSNFYVSGSAFESNISVGKDRVIHRVIADRKSGLYFGYDVIITPIAATNKFKVSFKSLSIKPSSSAYLSDLSALALPKYPGEIIVEDGDLIALDILERPEAQIKVVDQIRITTKPVATRIETVRNTISPTVRTAPPSGTRDFNPEAFRLRLSNVDLFINGEAVEESRSGRGASISGKLLYVYVPGKGRFIFSLSPQPGYGFRKTATIEDNKISFVSGGDTYKLISNSSVLGVGGRWNLWVLHDPDYKPNFKFPVGFVYGSSEQIQHLFRK